MQPLPAPLCRWLGDERVLVVEQRDDGSLLIYRNAALVTLELSAALRLTEQPRLPLEGGQRSRPRPAYAIERRQAQAVVRESAAREYLVWQVVADEELPGLVAATQRLGGDVPDRALQRLATLQADAARRRTQGKPPRRRQRRTQAEIEAERSAALEQHRQQQQEQQRQQEQERLQEQEQERTAALQQRKRHLHSADQQLRRVTPSRPRRPQRPVDRAIDRLLAELWQARRTGSAAPPAAPVRSPAAPCAEGLPSAA